ncbi:MAG: ABC transporter ATP-binding protein [Oscillospiraceae bacterium]|nr:ABC transporter ATP-binding protein [Oscillospiraceae bacterium]
MIEITNLTKNYGKIKAVDDISFSVQSGEIVGFLGPNGAGKTTTMNILTGYIPSTAGVVKVGGFDVMEEPEKVKSQIGYLPEQPPLYFDLTVLEYLMFVAELKKVQRNQRKLQVDEAMAMMRIGDHANRLVKNLSKGYKQRVGFAQALLGEPELLILDEPTIGLDPRQIIEMRSLIKSLGKKHTVILSSHILQEVSAVCERVIIINKGRIAAIDTPDNLSKNMGEVSRLTVTVEGKPSAIISAAEGIYGVNSVEVTGDRDRAAASYVIESDKGVDVRKPLFFALSKISCPILEMSFLTYSLEEIFLELIASERSIQDTQGEDGEGGAGGAEGIEGDAGDAESAYFEEIGADGGGGFESVNSGSDSVDSANVTAGANVAAGANIAVGDDGEGE